MRRLIEEISRSHFPNPPATPAQVAEFEAQMGWQLDADLRTFYLHCDGATLFVPRDDDPNYRILSLAEIPQATARLRRRDDSETTTSWYPVVDCQDSDFVLVDVAKPAPFPLLDAWHEAYPRRVRQIAASFGEFLERALSSNDHLYWLGE